MNYKLTSVLLLATAVSTPLLATAQNYSPLVGIPGITDPGLNFGDYINALYALSISVAALLAVIKIVIAGMKYMLSDVVTSKSEAISDIQGSVFGLIIVISAVLILTVINPNLTKTEIFLDPATDTPNTPAAAPGGSVTVKTGYKFAKAGTVPTFKADCVAVAGSIYRLEAGNDVCYDPLPTGVKDALDTTFRVATNQDTGEFYYPAANRSALLSRYQTAHYPRTMSNVDSIKADHNATDVHLGISLTTSDDWIDKANRSTLVATCDDLQRALNKTVRYVSGGNLSAGTGYIACISN